MTSNNDDLEQALQENLKLRRELAANVAKAEAASQRGVAYRLGWVLYWASIVSIALWCAYTLLEINRVGLPRTGGEFTTGDAIWLVVAFVVPALLIYGVGRLIRYILSGD